MVYQDTLKTGQQSNTTGANCIFNPRTRQCTNAVHFVLIVEYKVVVEAANSKSLTSINSLKTSNYSCCLKHIF